MILMFTTVHRKTMLFSLLPLDVYHEICSFSTRKSLYSLLTVSKEISFISFKYLKPHLDDNKAIRISSMRGNIAAVRKLLQNPQVDPSVKRNVSLGMACSYGYVEIVKLLLEDPRVDLENVDGDRIINLAAHNGYHKVVELLLSNQRIKFVNGCKKALKSAVRFGHIDTIKLLLQTTRVNPLPIDRKVTTLAIKYDRLRALELLIYHPRCGSLSR